MPPSDRRTKEKAAVRQRILDGAQRVFVRDGAARFSIRRVATEIDYSPGTLYLYFKDKNALLLALHQEALRCKGESLLPLLEIKDPLERIKAMGREYIAHGLRHPDEFRLMFVMPAPMDVLDRLDLDWRLGQSGFTILIQTLQEAVDAGQLAPDTDTHTLGILLWSTVHGLTMLHLSQRLVMLSETEQRDIQERVLARLDQFLLTPRNTPPDVAS